MLPEIYIGKICYNFVEKKIVTTPDGTTNNKREEIIIRLSYIGEITKRLIKQLNQTVQDTRINTTVRRVFKREQKISNYFKLKEKTPFTIKYCIFSEVFGL